MRTAVLGWQKVITGVCLMAMLSGGCQSPHQGGEFAVCTPWQTTHAQSPLDLQVYTEFPIPSEGELPGYIEVYDYHPRDTPTKCVQVAYRFVPMPPPTGISAINTALSPEEALYQQIKRAPFSVSVVPLPVDTARQKASPKGRCGAQECTTSEEPPLPTFTEVDIYLLDDRESLYLSPDGRTCRSQGEVLAYNGFGSVCLKLVSKGAEYVSAMITCRDQGHWCISLVDVMSGGSPVAIEARGLTLLVEGPPEAPSTRMAGIPGEAFADSCEAFLDKRTCYRKLIAFVSIVLTEFSQRRVLSMHWGLTSDTKREMRRPDALDEDH